MTSLPSKMARRRSCGKKLADNLTAKLGQTVYVGIPDGRGSSLVVSGIFRLPTGWPEDIAFVFLSTATNILSNGNTVSSVDVKLVYVHLADGIAANLRGYGYKVPSWQTLYPEISKTLAMEQFQNATALLRRNLLIYGLDRLIVPFIDIKMIDILIVLLRLK